MRLKLLQVGEPVLRQQVRPLSVEEIRGKEVKSSIAHSLHLDGQEKSSV